MTGSMKHSSIFRISFYNRGDIYELHARKISQSEMYAFVEVEEIIFGERSTVVVDPSEEKLKTEFAGVRRTYIPLQAIIRIDEVDREGASRIIQTGGEQGKITQFPVPSPPTGRQPDTK